MCVYVHMHVCMCMYAYRVCVCVCVYIECQVQKHNRVQRWVLVFRNTLAQSIMPYAHLHSRRYPVPLRDNHPHLSPHTASKLIQALSSLLFFPFLSFSFFLCFCISPFLLDTHPISSSYTQVLCNLLWFGSVPLLKPCLTLVS